MTLPFYKNIARLKLGEFLHFTSESYNIWATQPDSPPTIIGTCKCHRYLLWLPLLSAKNGFLNISPNVHFCVCHLLPSLNTFHPQISCVAFFLRNGGLSRQSYMDRDVNRIEKGLMGLCLLVRGFRPAKNHFSCV